VNFRVGDIQIDNQVLRNNDAIILKRQGGNARGGQSFVSLKYRIMKNEAIENLLHFKYFIFDLVPFELSLDGNFCDESHKYAVDVFELAKKYTIKSKQGEVIGAS